MLSRVFPAAVDNRYRALKPGLWLFALIALQKTALGLFHMFSADGGAQSVSTIPLDTYGAGAAQNVVAMFARLGLEQFLLGVLFLVALIRYRSLVPLMYAVALLHFAALQGIAALKPLALAGVSGAATMAYVIAGLTALGLILSLAGPGKQNRPAA
ncbi:MAG TPA: hypothetical protein VD713_03430 [Sphingomonadales bacterium]|nr:hypothetical protein [Sphingomonadales bacterium]